MVLEATICSSCKLLSKFILLRWRIFFSLLISESTSEIAKSFEMSDGPHPPELSPETPKRTESHPLTFVPAPFTTRPVPPYPQRAEYATFDPVFHHSPLASGPLPQDFLHANVPFNTPTPVEHRAGSQPHNGWRRQNVEVDTRRISVPPSLEITSSTFRDRLPYHDRSMAELTVWMPQPIVTPRRYCSEPVTRAERLAVRASDRPNDWGDYGWAEENDPHGTTWVGYDRSVFAIHGGVEDPNETAAVPNDEVLESIEAEGDPLIALRQATRDSQATIRGGLEMRIELEDTNWALRITNRSLENEIRGLEQSEANLRAELYRATTRFRTEQDRLENRVEQFELERNHYWARRNEERDRNQNLETQIQDLDARLQAAQALAVDPLIISPPVKALPVTPPAVIQPPVISPPIAPQGAGTIRVGGRERGGRGRRNAGTATRTQPKRDCKVKKTCKN